MFEYMEGIKSIQDSPMVYTDMYKRLDRAFPNSKFILTIRLQSKWLESMRRHYRGYSLTGFYKRLGVSDGGKLHMKRFGNPGDMIETFEGFYAFAEGRRNQQIKMYFQNRPEDLLIINLEEGNNWQKLCGFLKVPIPKEQFPHLNRSKKDGKK